MSKELEVVEHLIFNVPLDKQSIEELRAKFYIYKQALEEEKREWLMQITEYGYADMQKQEKLDKIAQFIIEYPLFYGTTFEEDELLEKIRQML